jgi:hypothetical protein
MGSGSWDNRSTGQEVEGEAKKEEQPRVIAGEREEPGQSQRQIIKVEDT